MILIVGGTGVLGSATTRRLLAQGEQVRVMTRTPEKAAALQKLGAEVVQGDLRDTESLRKACQNADKVLAAAHSIFGHGDEASKYVDLQGHEQLIDIARTTGVNQFVYTSAECVAADHPVPFFRMKYEVEQTLKRSGMRYTILRPTAFMETHAWELIGKPIFECGMVSLFGKGENPRNFVAANDVARFAVMALLDPQLAGQTIEIGGPENWTNMQVVRLFEALQGQPVQVSHIPLALLRVVVPIFRPFRPGFSQVMQSNILMETTDQTFDAQELLRKYPVKLTHMEDWARAIVPDRAHAVLTPA
jgi:uncharacterized protein YbjT (DUF2867 family)